MIQNVSLPAALTAAAGLKPAKPAKPAVPPELSADAKRHLQAARDAADLRQSMAAKRKELAREKVERLKQQMDKLALLQALDPKGMSRMLGNMAKELAGAVRDYADAGNPRELKREAEWIEARARAVEKGEPQPDKPVLGPVPADSPDKEADEAFLHKVGELRKRIETLFTAALREAAAKTADKAELDRLRDLARDFDDNHEILLKAEAEIAGWWRPAGLPQGAGARLDVSA